MVDELKDLLSNGVQTHDTLTGETFQLRACVLWTISDFLTYESLSGWGMTRFNACPICQRWTSSLLIRSKLSYLGHRYYLPPNHPWRGHRQYKANWGREDSLPPTEMSGEDILHTLDSVPISKPRKNPNNEDRKIARTTL